MGMFEKLSTEGLADAGDNLGGNFDPVPSAVYDATIKNMYVTKSGSSDAQGIVIIADCDGKEVKETVWITNRDGENFYADKQDPKKKLPLPGFTTVDDICLFTTEAPLTEQVTEEKMVKMYDPELRKEVPKPAQVLTATLNKPIKLGILRQIVDKQKKDENSGKYVNTGETRTENTIDKAFHPETGRTINEYKHEVTEPEFMTAWSKKNSGNDRTRAKGAPNGGVGSTGAGKPGGAAPASKSLFGNKS